MAAKKYLNDSGLYVFWSKIKTFVNGLFAGTTINGHALTKTDGNYTVTLTKADVGLGNVDDVAAIPATEKGAANGVASLDSSGKVPASQLPSYVDDVVEYANLAAFPAAGESGKIYVAIDTGLTYRWSGSIYSEISQSLGLGTTASTAFPGDRGAAAETAISNLSNQIGGLDLSQVGGDGKYIKFVSQSNGAVSASAQNLDTTISSSSTNNNAPTSLAVYNAIDDAFEEITDQEINALS